MTGERQGPQYCSLLGNSLLAFQYNPRETFVFNEARRKCTGLYSDYRSRGLQNLLPCLSNR